LRYEILRWARLRKKMTMLAQTKLKILMIPALLKLK